MSKHPARRAPLRAHGHCDLFHGTLGGLRRGGSRVLVPPRGDPAGGGPQPPRALNLPERRARGVGPDAHPALPPPGPRPRRVVRLRASGGGGVSPDGARPSIRATRSSKFSVTSAKSGVLWCHAIARPPCFPAFRPRRVGNSAHIWGVLPLSRSRFRGSPLPLHLLVVSCVSVGGPVPASPRCYFRGRDAGSGLNV